RSVNRCHITHSFYLKNAPHKSAGQNLCRFRPGCLREQEKPDSGASAASTAAASQIEAETTVPEQAAEGVEVAHIVTLAAVERNIVVAAERPVRVEAIHRVGTIAADAALTERQIGIVRFQPAITRRFEVERRGSKQTRELRRL